MEHETSSPTTVHAGLAVFASIGGLVVERVEHSARARRRETPRARRWCRSETSLGCGEARAWSTKRLRRLWCTLDCSCITPPAVPKSPIRAVPPFSRAFADISPFADGSQSGLEPCANRLATIRSGVPLFDRGFIRFADTGPPARLPRYSLEAKQPSELARAGVAVFASIGGPRCRAR